ncbi:c-type cytochrome biogenesis protein CcmI [Azotobacter chroococcum subsp. isscasi]|uniref:c-type cytochrome biogenesis protein CcmI n=1 Tax=Azotobacter chroococcum TaxID=353 RepID=UPI00103C1F5C|nr:c-type cytochrome biogenesis protein CcmI [Azotobacter chroococcum]TBW09619.1 c-type cytochrome biogenesis protein CcmI [Azotobacter chroococcum subsp. isscasi]
MIDFWIAAGLLLLLALAFLLLPVLRARRVQAEEDRTALNVALYEERLAELEAQRAAGTLDAGQLEAGRAEAARELLADTAGGEGQRRASLGKAVPMVVALLVPLLGYGLYLHWGASDKLELARQFDEQPKTLEEMTARLEEAVKVQPDSAEGWYFLGRTYMAQERPVDAVRAFEQAARLAQRPPEILGQWAQALYFAEGKRWNPQMQALTDEALAADPAEVTSLGLLGIAAFEERRFADAAGYWERLVAILPEGDPSRAAIVGGIARAREQAGMPESAPATAGQVELKVSVALAPELAGKVQPDDSVFVFARAVSGPPMPLAVERLRVADLPAQVALSDADAMMPQLRLSNFAEVQLVARVSRAGNPTAGDWVGQLDAVNAKASGEYALTIDRADAP